MKMHISFFLFLLILAAALDHSSILRQLEKMLAFAFQRLYNSLMEHTIAVSVLRKSYGRYIDQDVTDMFSFETPLSEIHSFFKAAYGDDFVACKIYVD